MSLDKTVIDSAVEKKYSDFSDAVKSELANKLASHPTVKKYADEFDKIQQMKSIFSKISTVE
jgi:hypothetical protein